jgi:hypothetical protein
MAGSDKGNSSRESDSETEKESRESGSETEKESREPGSEKGKKAANQAARKEQYDPANIWDACPVLKPNNKYKCNLDTSTICGYGKCLGGPYIADGTFADTTTCPKKKQCKCKNGTFKCKKMKNHITKEATSQATDEAGPTRKAPTIQPTGRPTDDTGLEFINPDPLTSDRGPVDKDAQEEDEVDSLNMFDVTNRNVPVGPGGGPNDMPPLKPFVCAKNREDATTKFSTMDECKEGESNDDCWDSCVGHLTCSNGLTCVDWF